MSRAPSTGIRPFPVVAITLMVLMLLATVALVVGLPQPDQVAAGSGDEAPMMYAVGPVKVPDSTALALSSLRETSAFQPPRKAKPGPVIQKLIAGHELRGTVVNEDGGFALMAKPGDEAVAVVSKNSSIGGWRLILVAPDRATFRKGEQRVTLILE